MLHSAFLWWLGNPLLAAEMLARSPILTLVIACPSAIGQLNRFLGVVFGGQVRGSHLCLPFSWLVLSSILSRNGVGGVGETLDVLKLQVDDTRVDQFLIIKTVITEIVTRD
jgi:hypothetical protein